MPADALAKVRTLKRWQGLTVAVDVFAGPLARLVLAEIDLGDTGSLPASGLPMTWLAEVTDDERFTGGRLAHTSPTGLAALLHEFDVGKAGDRPFRPAPGQPGHVLRGG